MASSHPPRQSGRRRRGRGLPPRCFTGRLGSYGRWVEALGDQPHCHDHLLHGKRAMRTPSESPNVDSAESRMMSKDLPSHPVGARRPPRTPPRATARQPCPCHLHGRRGPVDAQDVESMRGQQHRVSPDHSRGRGRRPGTRPHRAGAGRPVEAVRSRTVGDQCDTMPSQLLAASRGSPADIADPVNDEPRGRDHGRDRSWLRGSSAWPNEPRTPP